MGGTLRPVVLALALWTLAAPGVLAGDSEVSPLDAAPTANAGPDQTVNEDVATTFDGTASSDDFGIVNYTWTLRATPGVPRTLSTISGGAMEAQFDPIRPLVYALQDDAVLAVRIADGTVVWTHPLAHEQAWPMSMAIAPNGAYLAVGIPTGPRGYYEFGPYESYFASFDLALETKLGEFFVDEDVANVLASGDGHVIVGGGSGQWAGLRMFRADDGTVLPGRARIWQYDRITLHPSGTRTYSVTYAGLSPPTVWRSDIVAGQGFVTDLQNWPHHGQFDPGGRIWANPRGDQLLTGSGAILTSNATYGEDMRFVTDIAPGLVQASAFDPTLSLIAMAEGSYLRFVDMDTYEDLGGVDLGGAPTALGFRGTQALALLGDRVVAVSVPRIPLYGAAPTHTFTEPGTYVATLVVRDTAGMQAQDDVVITVRDVTPPQADAGPDRTVWRGTAVTFSGAGSSDNFGVASYRWTFTDGALRTLNGTEVTYVFLNAGGFDVTLTVSDLAGNLGADLVRIVVEVDAQAPVARAGTDGTVLEGALVVFDGGSSSDNVNITSYTWTFEDDGPRSLSGANVSHRFVRPGTYEVTLTVEDWEGNGATDAVVVTVRAVPLVPFVHAAHGYRIGLPQGWNVRRDVQGGPGRLDFLAEGPPSWNGVPTVAVTSARWGGPDTDEALLEAANDAIEEVRRQGGFVEIVQPPEIVITDHTRFAVFAICLPVQNVCEVGALAVSERHLRQWVVVGAAPMDDFEEWRPHFNGVIRSLEFLEPAELAMTRTAIVSVGAISLAAVACLLFGLRGLRGRRGRRDGTS